MNKILLFSFFFLSGVMAFGQTIEDSIVQFSGRVVAQNGNDLIPLPYTNIGIVGTHRGSVSDQDGFFSFVAVKGETVRFSRIGYKNAEYTVPDSLSKPLYFYVQIMSEDSILLPEAVIYPWPDREYFKYEFLAIDISDEERENLEKSLAKEVLDEIRYNVPVDGTEVAKQEIRQHAAGFKYVGQTKPQNIFNPLAWVRFVEAWRRGDFKKKEKKKQERKLVD